MKALLRPACALFACLTLLTGGIYPAFVTLGAQVLFPFQANGSLIEHAGHTVGSELIGQNFAEPTLFWGRPSATSPQPYNGAASSGSNLAPTNPVLIESIKARMAKLKAAHPDQTGAVPVDLVTASASGLDPHISPAAANFQIGRVAKARGVSESSLRTLVAMQTEQRTFGVLGEPRVNVLRLNLALTTGTQGP